MEGANLGEGEIMADEEQFVQVMIAVDQDTDVLLAVGSGTLTDITRFVSHRVRLPFVSITTAPSVDRFVSIGSHWSFIALKKPFCANRRLPRFLAIYGY